MKKEYAPTLLTQGNLFSSDCQQENKWTGGIDPELNLPDNIKASIEAAMNDLASRFPSLGMIDISRADWIEGTDVLATKSNNSIYLNRLYWTDLDFWEKYKKDWQGALIDPTPYGVIVHEAGHILDGQLQRALGADEYNRFIEAYVNDVGSISGEYTSAYGQENIFEFMAESFSCFYFQKCAQHTIWNEFQLNNCTTLWQKALEIITKADISKSRKIRPF